MARNYGKWLLGRSIVYLFALLQFTELSGQDSIDIAANPRYKAGSFKRWLLGKNYRQEWTTPVRVPILNISSYHGGLKPLRLGGGNQSRSLRLEDNNGREYALRSVEKYPDKTLPEELRETFVKDAVTDGISASYPFAGLSIPPIAKAASVPYMKPELFYVPDDSALGIFRSNIGKGLYTLEPREPDNIRKTWNTLKVQEELIADNDNRIDQKAVLFARLLDMYIMDFDRHEDQWRWGRVEKSDVRTYFPIPRDRDQPFFTNDGFLPHMISQNWIAPRFQGFRAKARDIRTFNFNARYFDRLFLTDLDEGDWTLSVDRFLPLMTDSVIDLAIQQQPVAIRDQHAKDIASKLKERRNYLKDEVMKYYRFVSKTVDITGSDKREYFRLTPVSGNKLQLTVFKINKSGNRTDSIYNRSFDPHITREIRLYGFNGDDIFHIEKHPSDVDPTDVYPTGGKKIRIRIVSGGGKDSLEIDDPIIGGGKLHWYDRPAEQNVKLGEGKVREHFSNDTSIHRYDPHNFKYNVTAPVIAVLYNPDDGVFFGGGVSMTRHGFRKDPYASKQKIIGTYAFATGAYSIRYEGEFINLVPLPFSDQKKLDLVVFANLKRPNYVQNFFGLGNETEFVNEGDKKISYYRSRFNLVELATLLRTSMGKRFTFLAGPIFQHFKIDAEENAGKFILDPNGGLAPGSGIDPKTVFEPKTYLGLQAQVIADTRKSEIMPTSGLLWNSFVRGAAGFGSVSKNLFQAQTDLSVYFHFRGLESLVIAARVGAGTNGNQYEFFQAQQLGNTENLRGFRKYRFAGDQMAFNNIDLRLKLAQLRGYILPGTLGLLAFHDIGRVWYDGEESGVWHNGYGGGLWLAPANRLVVSATYAYSKEGGLPFLSLGFQF